MSRIERVAALFASYPPLPFSYDAGTKHFQVGEDRVALKDYAAYVEPEVAAIDQTAAEDLINGSTILLGVFERLYQMPKMYEWLKGMNRSKFDEVNEGIGDVMIDAYAELASQEKNNLLKGNTLWDFGVSLYRPGHPVFRVLGNCACFGVDPHGMFLGEEVWEVGLAEYSMHNVDTGPQKVALMAGAGALSQLCNSETS